MSSKFYKPSNPTKEISNTSKNQSWDIFLSHSSDDLGTATRLTLDLQDLRYCVWIDYEKVYAGDLLTDKIINTIQNSIVFVLLWSKFSDSSRWVGQELQIALANGHRIILCLLDPTSYTHHSELVDLFWCNFCYSYEEGLAQLAKGLINLKSPETFPKLPSSYKRAPIKKLNEMTLALNNVLIELNSQNFQMANDLHCQFDSDIKKSLKQWPYDSDILCFAGHHYNNAVRIAIQDKYSSLFNQTMML
jgi:hypothetical protein